MPIISSSSAGSSRGLGQFSQQDTKLYVEDVFSTYLYTGTGTTQSIPNGVDLAGKGGMVWLKNRDGTPANSNHNIVDTVRGTSAPIYTNTTDAQTSSNTIASFDASGFSLGAFGPNASPNKYASWTFRKSKKFFDIVTYTGNATARTISHNLGSVPGCIIVKRTDSTSNWTVYHAARSSNTYLQLNTTIASTSGTTVWNNTAPTDTVFSIGTSTEVNTNGGSYIAYIFANETTADGIIQCGAYLSNGSASGPTVNLGWEPQFVLIKNATMGGDDWVVFDNMRGMPNMPLATDGASRLFPNTSAIEVTNTASGIAPLPTGFQILGTSVQTNDASSRTHIYIAIRRGPMRTPTDATKVFDTATGGGSSTGNPLFKSATVPVIDTGIMWYTPGYTSYPIWGSRLQGAMQLSSSTTAVESADTAQQKWDYQSGFRYYASGGLTTAYGAWMFRRAPGFMDVVCYSGTGAVRTVNHNLTVAPELIIIKDRSVVSNWIVYSAPTGANGYLVLNSSTSKGTDNTIWNNTSPTSSVFSLGTPSGVNASGSTFVAYLFASCPGVSKVGSYTGTAAAQQINCGFGSGARFVMIKRTDSSGDWYVYDTVRGISSGTDPYFLMNSAAAQVTGTDYIAPYSSGFGLTSTAPAGLNANGGTYIYLAIA